MEVSTDIIFDLDGTLIDSASSILEAFKRVLHEFSYTPKMPLNSDLIGPPLISTLQNITGESDSVRLLALADAFKKNYDNHAYALSVPYAGIDQVLEKLTRQKKRLYVATNKRLQPTQKIMQLLNWEHYFFAVYTIDRITPSHANKAAMLAALVFDLKLEPKNCVYIGDRLEDAQAANHSAMKFIYADWGYGPEANEIKDFLAKKPTDLIKMLTN